MKITLDSQEIEFHESTRLIFLHIDEPFYTAGKMFAWEGNALGIGINEKIMDFAIKNNARICVTVANNPDLYIKTAVKLKKFCDEKKSLYSTKGTKLYVIQWAFFDRVVD